MNRYETSRDFIKRFTDAHSSVSTNTITPVYFSINGDQAKASSNAYSIEQAEHGLIIFKYWYQVITQYDSCFVPLFFSADGEIEDYIVIDEWKLYFDKPKTSDFRCYGINVYMQKDNLKVSLAFNRSNVEEDFPKIWKLFKIVRNCKSQIELDYVVKIFKQGKEIDELKSKNLINEAKIDSLNMLIDSYKALLDKISDLVDEQPE